MSASSAPSPPSWQQRSVSFLSEDYLTRLSAYLDKANDWLTIASSLGFDREVTLKIEGQGRRTMESPTRLLLHHWTLSSSQATIDRLMTALQRHKFNGILATVEDCIAPADVLAPVAQSAGNMHESQLHDCYAHTVTDGRAATASLNTFRLDAQPSGRSVPSRASRSGTSHPAVTSPLRSGGHIFAPSSLSSNEPNTVNSKLAGQQILSNSEALRGHSKAVVSSHTRHEEQRNGSMVIELNSKPSSELWRTLQDRNNALSPLHRQIAILILESRMQLFIDRPLERHEEAEPSELNLPSGLGLSDGIEKLIAAIEGGFQQKNVVVIGDIIQDVVTVSDGFGTVTLRYVPGGAAIVAQTVKALGGRCSLITATGVDPFGPHLTRKLKENKIDVYIVECPCTPVKYYKLQSTPATLRENRSGNYDPRYSVSGPPTRGQLDGTVDVKQQIEQQRWREIDDIRESPAHSQLLTHLDTCVPNADIVVVSDYARGLLSVRAIETILDCARTNGKRVVVDPHCSTVKNYRMAYAIKGNVRDAFYMDLQEKDPENKTSSQQWKTHESSRRAEDSNRFELPGSSNATEAFVHGVCCKTVADLAPCNKVILTRGEKGLFVYSQKDEAMLPLYLMTNPVECSRENSIGAGDTALATLVMSLCVFTEAEFLHSALLSVFGGNLRVQLARTDIWHIVKSNELVDYIKALRGKCFQDGGRLKAKLDSLRTRTSPTSPLIVFTNGVFDVCCPGHVTLLQRAAALGDKLIVGINSDSSTRSIKGAHRPFVPESLRALQLAALSFVDHVVMYDDPTPEKLIDLISPHICVKGAEFVHVDTIERQRMSTDECKMVYLPIEDGYSTSQSDTAHEEDFSKLFIKQILARLLH